MRVYIGPYIDWIGPYQLTEILKYFGVKKETRYNIAEWLSEHTPINKICGFFHDRRSRKIKVKIHEYDTWSADTTLAIIILPILKQIRGKATQRNVGIVDDEDVPDHLKRINDNKNTVDEVTGGVDPYELRWNYVLDEMIWAFEQIQPDKEWWEQFYIDSKIADEKGLLLHHKRMQNGFRLFGKYYLSLCLLD